jgi:hypothetical protein
MGLTHSIAWAARRVPFGPWWRLANRLAPLPLPFAPSPTDTREWKVEIDPPATALPTPLPQGGALKVSLHRILIEAGIALTPATSSWDPRSWYALYRYGADFAGTGPYLRFYAGAADKDPRHSAVAAEEIATGVSCYLLHEHFGLEHIADAYACIQRGELDYVNPPSEERPDYFCEDSSGMTVIAESKGAVGTRSAVTRHIQPKGWSQVQNVVPTKRRLRSSCSRVVLGTHFCIDDMHPRSETTTLIKDPEGQPAKEDNADSDDLMRVSYAKALRFMQHDALAERLLLHQELPSLEGESLPQVNELAFLPLGESPFGDLFGIFGRTVKALFAHSASSIRQPVQESLSEFRQRRLGIGGGYALPNGIIVVHDADSVNWSE